MVSLCINESVAKTPKAQFVPIPSSVHCDADIKGDYSKDGNGYFTVKSGTINNFVCQLAGENKKSIGLKSETIIDGAIFTRDFGEIRVQIIQIPYPMGENLFLVSKEFFISDNMIRHLYAYLEPQKILNQDSVQQHIAELQSPDDAVRREAAHMLEGVRDQRAVEALIRALSDSDPDVRRRAARGLGAISESRAVEPLIKTLKDADPFVREVVAKALGSIKDERAIEALAAARQDNDSHVRVAASKAWQEITAQSAKAP